MRAVLIPVLVSAVWYASTDACHQNETLIGGNNADRSLLIADPRWSPFPATQVEGRTNRDGVNSPIHYSYAINTKEEDVIKRLFERVGDMRAMQGDTADAFFDELDLGNPQ